MTAKRRSAGTAGSKAAGRAPHIGRAKAVTAEQRLQTRGAALRADIDRELDKYRSERDGLVGDNVPDRAELSIADLIADVYLAEVDRDVVELLEVEGGLRRIAAGAYGKCIDCGSAIDERRLEVAPQVPRCLHCQDLLERARAGS